MKLEDNVVLKIFMLIVATALIVVGTLYVSNQIAVNSRARKIIESNDSQVKYAEDSLETYKQNFLFIVNSKSTENLIANDISTKQADYEESVSNIAIKDGINGPSINSAKLAKSQINNIIERSREIKNLFEAKKCLLEQINLIRIINTNIDNLNKEYEASIDYPSTIVILEKITSQYLTFETVLEKVEDCQEIYAVAQLDPEFIAILADDIPRIKTFLSEYITPLIDLYEIGNKQNINSFVENNYETKGSLSIAYPSLVTDEALDKINSYFSEELQAL